MNNRIVSEKDLGEAINMLMAGNIPASTSDVLNLVQRLQNTEVYSEADKDVNKPADEIQVD